MRCVMPPATPSPGAGWSAFPVFEIITSLRKSMAEEQLPRWATCEHAGLKRKRKGASVRYVDYVEESTNPIYAPIADFATIDQDINRTFGFDTAPMQSLRDSCSMDKPESLRRLERILKARSKIRQLSKLTE